MFGASQGDFPMSPRGRKSATEWDNKEGRTSVKLQSLENEITILKNEMAKDPTARKPMMIGAYREILTMKMKTCPY